MELLYLYLLIINAVSFFLMLADKKKAQKKKWRIKEHTLLGVALIGGSLGATLGMSLFRHKTQHLEFSMGLPVILAVHIILIILLHM